VSFAGDPLYPAAGPKNAPTRSERLRTISGHARSIFHEETANPLYAGNSLNKAHAVLAAYAGSDRVPG